VKKRPSAAAVARAKFDPDPPPMRSAPLPPPGDDSLVVERARPPPTGVCMLSRREVLRRIGLTYPEIWKLIREGRFPPARELTDKRVGWFEHEVDEWCLSRPIRMLKGMTNGTGAGASVTIKDMKIKKTPQM
jgi:predicted DNA-binding transcriptional regulator AlpA